MNLQNQMPEHVKWSSKTLMMRDFGLMEWLSGQIQKQVSFMHVDVYIAVLTEPTEPFICHRCSSVFCMNQLSVSETAVYELCQDRSHIIWPPPHPPGTYWSNWTRPLVPTRTEPPAWAIICLCKYMLDYIWWFISTKKHMLGKEKSCNFWLHCRRVINLMNPWVWTVLPYWETTKIINQNHGCMKCHLAPKQAWIDYNPLM